MVYEDLDAGDDTRRDGDHVGFPHPDGEGTALSDVTLDRGEPAVYDGTDLGPVSGDGSSEVTGIIQNLNVSGDTGQETIGADATVAMGGTVKADLTVYAEGTANVSVGSYVDDAQDLYVAEAIDASANLYEVRVR